MRWTWLGLLVSAWTSVARADIPVYPKRPEWDDTPLPMPDIPSLVLALALCAVVLFVLARRAER